MSFGGSQVALHAFCGTGYSLRQKDLLQLCKNCAKRTNRQYPQGGLSLNAERLKFQLDQCRFILYTLKIPKDQIAVDNLTLSDILAEDIEEISAYLMGQKEYDQSCNVVPIRK